MQRYSKEKCKRESKSEEREKVEWRLKALNGNHCPVSKFKRDIGSFFLLSVYGLKV